MRRYLLALTCLFSIQVTALNGHRALAQNAVASDPALIARTIDKKMDELRAARQEGNRPGMSAAERDASNARLRQMKAELQELGKKFFGSLGIEVDEIVMGGKHPSLKIRASNKTLFNRFALNKGRDFEGLTFIFNPSELSSGIRTAVYDTDTHTVSFARGLEEMVRSKSPVLFHELIHGILSTYAYKKNVDTIFGSILAKKRSTNNNDSINTYAGLMTVQEFLTYSAQAVQELELARQSDIRGRAIAMKNAVADMIFQVVVAEIETGIAMTELLEGIESGSAKVAINEEPLVKTSGVEVKVENATYSLTFAFSNGNDEVRLREAAKMRLTEIKSLAHDHLLKGEAILISSGMFSVEDWAEFKETLLERPDMMSQMTMQMKKVELGMMETLPIEMTEAEFNRLRSEIREWNTIVRKHYPSRVRGNACRNLVM